MARYYCRCETPEQAERIRKLAKVEAAEEEIIQAALVLKALEEYSDRKNKTRGNV